ncbi:Coleoptericin domain containing protein [Asbolus verrucosus]|uniref:Coleoptericin domain containing protein n=1 Tax=Asbolus verrucosus TaxID=1661398 RepID=A0A482W2J6_ASBVE|nr:Coleoptericin domain containing protein [Asbolus verrucosus]
MIKLGFYFVLIAFVASASAIPAEYLEEYQYDPDEVHQVYSPVEVVYELQRSRRSLQPGAPNFPAPPQNGGGWSVNPNVERGEDGNTKTSINVEHKGKDHDFHAGWGKVVRGPNKAKPTWNVGGTFRW